MSDLTARADDFHFRSWPKVPRVNGGVKLGHGSGGIVSLRAE